MSGYGGPLTACPLRPRSGPYPRSQTSVWLRYKPTTAREVVDIMLGLPSDDERPRGRFASSVLVITVPVLLLAVLGLITGGLGVGTPELTLLMLIWVIGLLWVWWPWRRRHQT